MFVEGSRVLNFMEAYVTVLALFYIGPSVRAALGALFFPPVR